MIRRRTVRKGPRSGSEPRYNPEAYNGDAAVKDQNNCFGYAFNIQEKDKDDAPFMQPGLRSGFPPWHKIKGKRCPDLMARLLGDVPGLQSTTFEQRCPKGTSKIAAVIDAKRDYHFYRQDSNGNWSHKPGSTDVTNLDAKGRLITNPELAARNYNRDPNDVLNYNTFCGYMCIPRTRTYRFKRGGSRSFTTKTRGSRSKTRGSRSTTRTSPRSS